MDSRSSRYRRFRRDAKADILFESGNLKITRQNRATRSDLSSHRSPSINTGIFNLFFQSLEKICKCNEDKSALTSTLITIRISKIKKRKIKLHALSIRTALIRMSSFYQAVFIILHFLLFMTNFTKLSFFIKSVVIYSRIINKHHRL